MGLLLLSRVAAQDLDCVYPNVAINKDISSALAQNGAIVYIVGRRKEKLETAVKMHPVPTFVAH